MLRVRGAALAIRGRDGGGSPADAVTLARQPGTGWDYRGDVKELTSEQFMALADGVFDAADATGRVPRAVCPTCNAEGPVAAGDMAGTLLFPECGHAFTVPAVFRTARPASTPTSDTAAGDQ